MFDHMMIEVDPSMSDEDLSTLLDETLMGLGALGRVRHFEISDYYHKVDYDSAGHAIWINNGSQVVARTEQTDSIHLSVDVVQPIPDGTPQNVIEAIEDFDNIVYWVFEPMRGSYSELVPGLCSGCGKYEYVYTDDLYREDVEGSDDIRLQDYGYIAESTDAKGHTWCIDRHKAFKPIAELAAFDPCI